MSSCDGIIIIIIVIIIIDSASDVPAGVCSLKFSYHLDCINSLLLLVLPWLSSSRAGSTV
jgi:hypothetical protein